jgi:hypothetical protein
VYLSADGTYASHFKARKASADGAARAYGSHLREDQTPMKLRKLIVTAAIQPVLSYASEIWSRATQDHRNQLDGWQMGHDTSMLGLPATAAHPCIQQELGILPFHVVCEATVLKFRHRLYRYRGDDIISPVRALFAG